MGVTDGPTDGRTDGWTDGRMDTPSYRDARTHLKIVKIGQNSGAQNLKKPVFWPTFNIVLIILQPGSQCRGPGFLLKIDQYQHWLHVCFHEIWCTLWLENGGQNPKKRFQNQEIQL